MNSFRSLAGTLFVLVVMSGCAAQKYKPARISAVETASQFQARTLTDSGLQDYIASHLGRKVEPWPPTSWDPEMLTLAALYFNPQLVTARAQAEAAQAAVTSAGARPNPTLSLSPGVPSPYLLGLDFSIPVETRGKRRIRIARAEHLSDAARFGLAAAFWRVRSQVRLAVLNFQIAERRRELLRKQQDILTEQLRLLHQRLAVGEIPRPEVDTARVALLKNQIGIQAAQGNVGETLAALAAAIGVPARALEAARISWPDLDRPPDPDTLSPSLIQRDAVLNRLDVRRALAQYAASEDALRLEIARQHPNFNIGPGYQYEERNNFFTILFSSTLPLFNRNQGPIAEAEARRKEAAGNFLAVQAQGIAQSESALQVYRAAFAQLREARQSLLTLQTQREGIERRAVQLGESDELALNGILLERAAAATLELDALAQSQAALGALEDAVQKPLDPSWQLPAIPDPDRPESKVVHQGKHP